MTLQDFPPTQTITNPIFPGGTSGNILFFGSGGTVSQNAALFWDNTNAVLQLGAQGAIKYLSQGTAFATAVYNSTFNGVRDDVFGIAYNRVPGTAGTRINNSEPEFAQTIEAHYYDGVNHWMEVNWDYLGSDGVTSKRFFDLQINRTTHHANMACNELDAWWMQNSSVFYLKFSTVDRQSTWYDSTGNPLIILDTTSDTTPLISVNNARWFAKGTENMFIGLVAGTLTVSGTKNTGVGSGALGAVSSGAQNNALGAEALNALTTGSRNTACGDAALSLLVSGVDNAAFGSAALTTTTASSNSAFGSNAMQKTTSGGSNSAFGASALFNNLTNINNCAFGYQALYTNTADGNCAFGYQALLTNASGANNNAFGNSALFNCTAGSNNAFGTTALYNLTSATGNNAFGYRALYTNQTGTINNAFGAQALEMATGGANSAFGNLALQNVAGGTSNVAFGASAGLTITSGFDCTLIGTSSDVTVNSLGRACAIGFNAKVSASNMMALGGTGTDTVSVVIGGTTASARFHVIEKTLESEVFRIESIATNDDPNYRAFQGRVTTTDATQTTLQTIAITASNTYRIKAYVTARRTGGTGGTAEDAAAYELEGTYKTVTGTVTLVGAVAALYTAEDQAGWDATLDINGTNVRVRVTGAVNNNVTWHGTVILSNVGT